MRRVRRPMPSPAVMSTLIPLGAQEAEKTYCYNYDYWGDVQDAPSSYSVCRVFTSSDLGLETNFSAPKGLTVAGDKIYVCDTVTLLHKYLKEDKFMVVEGAQATLLDIDFVFFNKNMVNKINSSGGHAVLDIVDGASHSTIQRYYQQERR